MWEKYFEAQKGREVYDQVTRAVIASKDRSRALDLGSGNFIESNYLADYFDEVYAVDNFVDVTKYPKKDNVIFTKKPFIDIAFPQNTFDLIIAQYSLPFYGKKDFDKFFKNIISWLKPNGIIAGQFFGKMDGWSASKSKLIFHNKTQALNLLKSLDVIEFIEVDEESITELGILKHWHRFDFIARKKSGENPLFTY